MNAFEFGQRIKEQRNALGLSQSAFAKLCGFTQHKVSRIERGAGRIDAVSDIPKLCDALQVMPEWFWMDYEE